MVLLNGNKYACETCIKGHRSSNCRHTDRPLFEIKKKGRPVTQCDHCRELRKTKQVHVKCICEAKEDHPPAQSSGTKKGHTKIPDCATFPNGLPQAMGASVAESSSESDNGGMRPNTCQCKTTGTGCNCCVPRKSAPRHRKKDPALPQHAAPHADPMEPVGVPSSSSKTPSHILARLAELRPVLPRPSHRNRTRSDSGPAHDPSSDSAHGHTTTRRSHENAYYSPYGRAYDANHDLFDNITAQKQDSTTTTMSQSQNNFPIPPSSADSPAFPTDEQVFRDQLRALEAAANAAWMAPPGMEGVIPSFPSTCGCGDNCRCPGCIEHNPDASPASSAFSSCMNPGSCTTCLDCTILSLPASLPPDTALSIYDAFQTNSLDDWIRDVSSLPPRGPSENVSPPPPTAGTAGLVQAEQPPWDRYRYIPPMTESLPPDTTAYGYTVKPCCGVLCKCDPDTCECVIEDENGYDCRREMLFPTFDQQQRQQQTQQPPFPEDQAFSQHLDSIEHHGRARSDSGHHDGGYFDGSTSSTVGIVEFEPGRFFGYPEPPRSRSSSTSTSSSHSHSHSNSSRGIPSSQSPFTTQPLPLHEYGTPNTSPAYPWQPPGRVVRGSFYAGQGQTSSISSPNLVLRLQTERSTSRGSSPASASPALSAPGGKWD